MQDISGSSPAEVLLSDVSAAVTVSLSIVVFLKVLSWVPLGLEYASPDWADNRSF